MDWTGVHTSSTMWHGEGLLARTTGPPPASHIPQERNRLRRTNTLTQARLSGGRYPDEARGVRIESSNINPGVPEADGTVLLGNERFVSIRVSGGVKLHQIPRHCRLGLGSPSPPSLDAHKLPGYPFNSPRGFICAEAVAIAKYCQDIDEYLQQTNQFDDTFYPKEHRSLPQAPVGSHEDQHLIRGEEGPSQQDRHNFKPVTAFSPYPRIWEAPKEEATLVPPDPVNFDYSRFLTKPPPKLPPALPKKGVIEIFASHFGRKPKKRYPIHPAVLPSPRKKSPPRSSTKRTAAESRQHLKPAPKEEDSKISEGYNDSDYEDLELHSNSSGSTRNPNHPAARISYARFYSAEVQNPFQEEQRQIPETKNPFLDPTEKASFRKHKRTEASAAIAASASPQISHRRTRKIEDTHPEVSVYPSSHLHLNRSRYQTRAARESDTRRRDSVSRSRDRDFQIQFPKDSDVFGPARELRSRQLDPHDWFSTSLKETNRICNTNNLPAERLKEFNEQLNREEQRQHESRLDNFKRSNLTCETKLGESTTNLVGRSFANLSSKTESSNKVRDLLKKYESRAEEQSKGSYQQYLTKNGGGVSGGRALSSTTEGKSESGSYRQSQTSELYSNKAAVVGFRIEKKRDSSSSEESTTRTPVTEYFGDQSSYPSTRPTTARTQTSEYQQEQLSYLSSRPTKSHSRPSEVRQQYVSSSFGKSATSVVDKAKEIHTPERFGEVTQQILRRTYGKSPPPPPPEFPELVPAPLSVQKSPGQSPPTPITEFPQPSFLDSCLPAEFHLAKMDLLQVRSADRSSTKVKAVEDARQMQASIIEEAKKSGKDPPKYVLMELIGKGSFGRVYKGKDMGSAAVVAVKIIDIDESDTLNPRLADTYSEFMKEVNALKILSDSKARNINHVIEALPVGKAMWMITEYCGGGSIATLMKPTPGGLKERWIIPILREVAEAVKWVHQAGIIHRDLKCANVLITEDGGVQLCDFGVAGITHSNVDKRSTFIGTMNWMAPELFDSVPQYGKEVDIWAFGSMAYEMATGLPPNAMSGMKDPQEMGPYLKQHIPRLEGVKYSEGLCDIVAYCLEENAADRPVIEAVQKHAYIYNSQIKYPASSLSELVKAFKKWEDSGGTRRSLFMLGGAQGPAEIGSNAALGDENWNFSTTAAFDQVVAQGTNVQDVINVYGSSVDLTTEFTDETSRPGRQQQARSRRRPPPEALAPLKAPLEKLFDPNTVSNYNDNSRTHYGRDFALPTSDLPLRDDSAQNSIRDTMIDLGGHDVETGLSSFPNVDTIRASRKFQDDDEDGYAGAMQDFNRPPLSDPADNINRRTQDWKFPSMAPPASADPEVSRFPVTYDSYEIPLSHPTPGSGARPALVHHATDPIAMHTQGVGGQPPSAPSSPNRMSLIDLDLSLPEPSRPSTADSMNSNGGSSTNPFEFERHASAIYQMSSRGPSLYLNEDSGSHTQLPVGNTFQDLADVSDFSASDAESNYGPSNGHNDRSLNQSYDPNSYIDSELSQAHLPVALHVSDVSRPRNNQVYDMSHFAPLPPPPSVAAMSGTASQEEMIAEMQRIIAAFTEQLNAFKEVYEALAAGYAAKKEREKSDRED